MPAEDLKIWEYEQCCKVFWRNRLLHSCSALQNLQILKKKCFMKWKITMEISVKPKCKIATFAQKHQDTPKSAKITYANRANALYTYKCTLAQMYGCQRYQMDPDDPTPPPSSRIPLTTTRPNPFTQLCPTILAWAFYHALVRGVFILSRSHFLQSNKFSLFLQTSM